VVAVVWLVLRWRHAVDDRGGHREERWYGGPGFKPPEDEWRRRARLATPATRSRS